MHTTERWRTILKMGSPIWIFGIFFLITLLPSQTGSVAVMSVDLGSEWMKVAIVKPGVPMEIVLNKESRRKTPVVIALKENERLFGDNALGMAVKNPKVTFRYFQDLLGKKADNPQVQAFMTRFPEYELVEDKQRGTVLFKLSDEFFYSPEELLGMMLNYSRSLSEEFAEQPVKDVVITVPAFFNQAERRAVLRSAQLAGLKVLQLINDNTAVALNYGVFRRKDINATAQSIMFYDMGSRSTVCTIVTYQTVKTKDSGTQPQLQIRGVGFDRTLGGLEIDLRLREHLAKLFNGQKKSKKDVRENPRAMAKLLKEANRVKTILSANNDHMAQIEGLLDDIDFRVKVTRQELEVICADVFARVSPPVQQALSSAEMNLDEIDQVILVGGATRVPKVQEILLKAVGKEELGKNINADEAAAMGAVYQAAALSKAFKVKPFIVRDAAVFPIQVEFTREVEEENNIKSLKHNRRILFQRLAPYPQRKVITFNRYNDDFDFHINYGDLGFLGPEDLQVFGSLNLTTVKLKGVGDSFQKRSDYESKGIKAHFNMDESGLLSLDRVEAVFETVVEEKPEQESTLTKLGNTISSLFGGGSTTQETQENTTDNVQEEDEVPNGATKEEDHVSNDPSSEKQDKEKENKEGEKGTKEEDKAESQKEAKEGEAGKESESGKAAEEESKKTDAPKKQKVVDEIEVEQTLNDIPDLLGDDMKKSTKKINLVRMSFARFLRGKREQRSPVNSARHPTGWRMRALQPPQRSARMIPGDDQIFTDVELSTLEKLINDTWIWKNEILAEQAKLRPTEKPVLLSKDIEMKLGALDREIQYLLNKAKFAKPKSKKKNNTTKSETSNKNATENEEKVIPPTEPSKEEENKESEPVKEPPVEEKTDLPELGGSEAESTSQKPPVNPEENHKTEL
uniref:Hypoxia up-regulated protein 1 n=1 Tax=Leptobrachium leishanense TaxID=445787 RepID=A0A8C5R6W7_9ANUR